jgi:DNA-binding MarR family transcriptional regulator
MLSINYYTVKRVSENFSEAIAYKIHKAVFVIDKTADSSLQAKADLTLSQFLILMNIVQKPGLTQIEIAVFLEVTQSAVSRQIEVLKNKNLITIRKNEENRRENLLFPTSLGKNVFTRSNQILNEAFDELYNVMNSTEKENLEKSLDKLLSSVCGRRKSWDC